jgi:hypothetical protein
MTTTRWVVQVHGDTRGRDEDDSEDGDEYEISVRNERGDRNYGWSCEDKIILFDSSGSNDLNPGTPEQFQFAMKVAQILCDGLNAAEVKA